MEHTREHRDRIELRDLVFFGTHGVNPEETALGQRFGVDITLWLDLSLPAQTDDLQQTVSYATIYKLIRKEVEGVPSKLLEHLAARILRQVLLESDRIAQAEVRLSKISPPLKGSSTGEVAVTLLRRRDWLRQEVLP